MNFYYSYNPILIIKTSDNGESERQETLIGKVQKNDFLPMPTGFSLNIGTKEPPYEERKRYYRNSSSVSQVSAVQAQTSASCCRTPSDCSDRILRHCDRFKNSSNRVPVHKTVMGKNKTLTPSAAWHKGFYIMFGLRLHDMSKTSHLSRLVLMQRYNKNLYINLKVFVCKLFIVKIIHNLPCNYVYKFLTKIFYNTKYCRKSAAIGFSNLHQVTDYKSLKYICPQFPVLKVVGLNPTGVTNLQVIENQLITNISSRYFEHPP